MKLGMDFGTTTSATVAIVPPKGSGQPIWHLCGDVEGRPVPSAIAINRTTGDVVRGREAWDRKTELAETSEYIHSIKAHLGHPKIWEIGGRRLTPVDMTREVLAGLMENVQKKTHNEAASMTVAVPVGFGVEKRADLRKAASALGVEIDAFVSEPTAAFFANYAELKSASTVAVFDWGGGTLDVSVLKIGDGGVEEIGTAGLAEAGDDIDRELAARIHSRFARSRDRPDVAFSSMSPAARDSLLVQCERAKRQLGNDDVARLSIARYGVLGPCTATLEYDWFEDITRPLMDRAVACLDNAFAEAKITDSNIDYLVMNGGSSNLRPIIERLEPRFGDRLYFPDETMWNVARGAAMLAATPGAYRSAQNIDLVLAGGERFRLLSRGEALGGWHRRCTFGIIDATSEARLVIDTGDGSPGCENLLTWDIPSYGFLHEKIILEASISEDRVLVIRGRSSSRPSVMSREWTFPKLRIYYELPKEQL